MLGLAKNCFGMDFIVDIHGIELIVNHRVVEGASVAPTTYELSFCPVSLYKQSEERSVSEDNSTL